MSKRMMVRVEWQSRKEGLESEYKKTRVDMKTERSAMVEGVYEERLVGRMVGGDAGGDMEGAP